MRLLYRIDSYRSKSMPIHNVTLYYTSMALAASGVLNCAGCHFPYHQEHGDPRLGVPVLGGSSNHMAVQRQLRARGGLSGTALFPVRGEAPCEAQGPRNPPASQRHAARAVRMPRGRECVDAAICKPLDVSRNARASQAGLGSRPGNYYAA